MSHLTTEVCYCDVDDTTCRSYYPVSAYATLIGVITDATIKVFTVDS
jgi:hypothetical protein